MILTCYNCREGFEVRGYNLATITSRCPVCGLPNHYDSGLERTYGKVVGEIARRVMAAVGRLTEKRWVDNLMVLQRAQEAIEGAIVIHGVRE